MLSAVPRPTLTRNLLRLRGRLKPLEDLAIPSIDAIDAEAERELRQFGAQRLGCAVAVIRYRPLAGESEDGALQPPSSLPRSEMDAAALRGAAALLRSGSRSSDLLLALPPDSLVLLSPGARPLESQSLVGRLTSLLDQQRIPLASGELVLMPRFAYSYLSPLSWVRTVSAVAHDLRASLVGGPEKRGGF